MAISSWLCSNSTKNMVVKIVHPGGHVELHEKPVLAAEVMLRNPRSCVAHPHVFKQPWAVVAPETMLMPGQKFYIVPIRTVRKLQRLSPKNSPSYSVHEILSVQSCKGDDLGEEERGMVSPCNWFFINKKNNTKRGCFICLFMGIKIKENGNGASSQETTSSTSSNIASPEGRGVITRHIRAPDFTRNRIRGSPKRFQSLDQWQPSLESVKEE